MITAQILLRKIRDNGERKEGNDNLGITGRVVRQSHLRKYSLVIIPRVLGNHTQEERHHTSHITSSEVFNYPKTKSSKMKYTAHVYIAPKEITSH